MKKKSSAYGNGKWDSQFCNRGNQFFNVRTLNVEEITSIGDVLTGHINNLRAY